MEYVFWQKTWPLDDRGTRVRLPFRAGRVSKSSHTQTRAHRPLLWKRGPAIYHALNFVRD